MYNKDVGKLASDYLDYFGVSRSAPKVTVYFFSMKFFIKIVVRPNKISQNRLVRRGLSSLKIGNCSSPFQNCSFP